MKRAFTLVLLVCGALLGGCGDDGGDDGGAGSGSAGKGGSGSGGSGSGGNGDAGSGGSGTAGPKLTEIQADIFTKSCALSASCHGGTANGPNLLDGKTHASVVDAAAKLTPGKKYVVAGDPDNSMLYQVLKGPVGSIGQMPVGQPLPADKIEQVRAWIAAGAKND